MHTRYIKAQGTAIERGKIIGQQWKDSIPVIQKSLEKAAVHEDQIPMAQWLPQARRFLPCIEKYAPETLKEMEGFSRGSNISFEDILLITCVYEKHFKHPATADHCTSVAAMGTATESGDLICGQTNDENILHWAAGQLDCVLHHIEPSGLETLIYTHPGIPAYMGMNSAGLCVLWMAIDNNERAIGLPTNILIRELLRFTTLKEAANYLKTVPKSLPNNYLLSHPNEGICNIECSPGFFRPIYGDTHLCHANHILDPEMAANDVKKEDPENSSFNRYKVMSALIEKYNGEIGVKTVKKMLSDHTGYPRSICSHPRTDCFDSKTLASMVFQPAVGTMHISFGNGCEKSFYTYSLISSRL